MEERRHIRRNRILKLVFAFGLMAAFIITISATKGKDQVGAGKAYAASDYFYAGIYYVTYTDQKTGKKTKEFCFMSNGEIQYDFNGLMGAQYVYGKDGSQKETYDVIGYYFEKGKIAWNKSGIVTAGWQSTVLNPTVVLTFLHDENSRYNIKNGVLVDVTGPVKIGNEWYFTTRGCINEKYTGFAENENGAWYVEKGKVNFSKNGIIKGGVKRAANKNCEYGWWYVKGGKVQCVNTVEKNANGWWAIIDGKVDFHYTGVLKNANGWWYCENGKADFNYTGFGENANGWWYCKNGKVDFGKNGVIKGVVQGQTGWWFVKGGKVQFTESVESNSNGWWYIKSGNVDFTYTGVAKNKNGWWYCKNGKVDFGFTGIGANKNGLWYCRNGKVDFTKNGTVKYDGISYKVTKGKAVPLNHYHEWKIRTVSDNDAFDVRVPEYKSEHHTFCCDCNRYLGEGGPCEYCEGLDAYGDYVYEVDHYNITHIDATTHDERYCTKCGMITELNYR